MISYLIENSGGGALIGAVIAASLVAAGTQRHRGWAPATEAALITASIAGILAITVGRSGMPDTVSLAAAVHWVPKGPHRFALEFMGSEEIWLNIALFVPAAFLLTLRGHRPVTVIAGLAVLSASIEVTQGILSLGTPDASDILSNALGA